jgi:DNA-binding CsgD family transcriptional regulator
MAELVASPESPSGVDVMGQLTPVLQGVHLPCWIVDEDGVFVWVNDAFIATFGERRGEHYSAVFAPESLEIAARHFARLYVENDDAPEVDLDMVLPDGRTVSTEISSVFLESIGLCCGAFGLAGMPVTLRPEPAARAQLTPRQLEVLVLLARGASTAQIAAELYISTETVRNHVRAILFELRVHSRLAAVAKARGEGIIGD